jgi:hypothetical protein
LTQGFFEIESVEDAFVHVQGLGIALHMDPAQRWTSASSTFIAVAAPTRAKL